MQGQRVLRHRHLWCISGSPGVQCLEQKQGLEQQGLVLPSEETQDILSLYGSTLKLGIPC